MAERVGPTGPRSDESFLDDKINAEAAARKSALDRQALGRAEQIDRSRIAPGQKVEETTKFRGTQADDESSHLAKAFKEGETAVNERQGGPPSELAANEQQAEGLMAHLQALEDALAALMKDGLESLKDFQLPPGVIGGRIPERLTPEIKERLLARLEKQLMLTEQQAKQILQRLLSGGTSGLVLVSDPRIAFERLFRRLARWPKRARPGRRPDSDTELDAFLAWVFEPPELTLLDDEEVSVW